MQNIKILTIKIKKSEFLLKIEINDLKKMK